MTIFWDPADQRWCDECDEYLQQYHSLALLQDEQVIPDEKLRPGYEKQTGQEKHRSCRMKWRLKSNFLSCFFYFFLRIVR